MHESFIGKTIFQHWHVTDIVGEGSFGKVYKIQREEFGVKYEAALKVITVPKNINEYENLIAAGFDDTLEDVVQELNREIRVMDSLKGVSNIVSYEDHLVLKHENDPGWDVYIRMEYLTPIREYFRKKKNVSAREIIKLGIDVCNALEICSKKNIIHRDIKPENIFISSNGHFKLGDFGVSKSFERLTDSFSKKGTINYMAPEVNKGEKYDATIDTYSLGVLLYTYFNNGRLPFIASEGKVTADDREKAINKRMTGETLEKPVNATLEISKVILKACEYLPHDRYQSAGEMKKALEALLNSSESDFELTIVSGMSKNSSVSEDDKKEIGGETNFLWERRKKKVSEETVDSDKKEDIEDYKNDDEDNEQDEAPAKKKLLKYIICGVLATIVVIVLFVAGASHFKDTTDVNSDIIESTTEETTVKKTEEETSAEIETQKEEKTTKESTTKRKENNTTTTRKPSIGNNNVKPTTSSAITTIEEVTEDEEPVTKPSEEESATVSTTQPITEPVTTTTTTTSTTTTATTTTTTTTQPPTQRKTVNLSYVKESSVIAVFTATTSFNASSVSLVDTVNGHTYRFQMHKAGGNTWYFRGEFTESGTHTIKCEARDSSGAFATDYVTMSVTV